MKYIFSKKNIFIVFLMIFVISNVYAITFESLLNKLSNKEKSISSLSFKFSQEFVMPETKDVTKSKGELFFRKPDKFSVENFSPFKQLLVSDGKVLWVYNKDERQVIIRSVNYLTDQDNFMHFFSFIYNFEDWQKEYELNFLFEEDDKYLLAMNSKKIQGVEIYLKIDKENLFPREIEMKSEQMNVVTKIFNLKYNKKIVDDKFKLIIPKGVEVWDQVVPQ